MTKLRVALDARTLQGEPLGGVGRSTRAVVAAVRGDVDLVLLTDARQPRIEIDLPQRALLAPMSSTMAAWLQLAVPRALASFPGIFHCPWYGLPFRQPVPMVVTMYDLTFEHGRAGFRRGQRLMYRLQARWAARTAAHVLTGSEYVRAELRAKYRIDDDRLSVQPTPLDPRLLDVDPSHEVELRRRLGIAGRYVVAVGGAARRRVDLALAAWPRVRTRSPDVTLVVLGDTPLRLPPGAVAAGSVSDAEWASAIAGASALLYPTEFEGFGYPALEAMALGTPVVSAKVGSLPEVVGDACWFDRHDPEAIAAAVTRLLTDPDLEARLIAAGRARTASATALDLLRERVVSAYELASARRTESPSSNRPSAS